jgi:cytoskeletal protein CcmA (bactofilin family)
MDTQRQQQTGIGAGVSISGDLTAQEPITLHGRIDGQVTVPDHHVLIAASAVVRAKIIAHSVTVQGNVDGTIVATERVTVDASAIVKGHLMTPMLALADGAQFNGSVDPTRTEAAMQVAKYRQKQADNA